MPISRDEFYQGRLDLSFPIRRLLETRSELAFTAVEVFKFVAEETRRDVVVEEVVEALEKLVETGYVGKKSIAGELYYAIIQRGIGFRRG